MTEHDDSLEIGIAAGMDVPMAMAISSRDEPPKPSGCSLVLAVVILIGTIWLLR